MIGLLTGDIKLSTESYLKSQAMRDNNCSTTTENTHFTNAEERIMELVTQESFLPRNRRFVQYYPPPYQSTHCNVL